MSKAALKPSDPAWPADDAQVQTNRGHPLHRCAFFVQPVEGVDAVAGEVVAEHDPAATKRMSFVSEA